MIPKTVVKYGIPEKYDTHIDTKKPFKIIGGNIAKYLDFAFLVKYAASNVTKLPHIISIMP